MRLRNNPNAGTTLLGAPHVAQDPPAHRGRWKPFFGNERPIHLEIGAGKGGYATAFAAFNPALNIVAVEKSKTVAAVFAKKAAGTKALNNLKIVVGDAGDLEKWFAPGEVAAIHLNFSDPWPKHRHAARRLTNVRFVQIYKNVLTPGGRVALRTDNDSLYAFTLTHLAENGIPVVYNSKDVHAGRPLPEGKPFSEYERKFVAAGKKIKVVEFAP